MNAPEFKPGDNVKLKAGGPVMTVQDVRGLGVTCAWFNGASHNRCTFHALSLAHF